MTTYSLFEDLTLVLCKLADVPVAMDLKDRALGPSPIPCTLVSDGECDGIERPKIVTQGNGCFIC